MLLTRIFSPVKKNGYDYVIWIEKLKMCFVWKLEIS